ncbi:MAG: FHIPEP family type III secretion protein [Planctomycetaceae bacterium]|nr:FHIPEP family type III secretion protein [Planctomycetaceae bacterium]
MGCPVFGVHLKFLSQFVHRNFSIERGRQFTETGQPGAATKSDAQLCFEEALEQAKDLQLGVVLWLGSAQSEEQSAELRQSLEAWVRWVGHDPGLVLPEVRVVAGERSLQTDDLRIQLNDVRLPALRGLPSDGMVVVSSQEILSSLGIESHTIVDPASGMSWLVVKDAADVRAKCREANLGTSDSLSTAFVRLCLDSAMTLHAGSFVAAPIFQFLVDRQKRDYADLIRQVQARLETFAGENARMSALRWTLTAVLRNLLDELAPVRDLRSVLESLLYVRELTGAQGGPRIIYSRTPFDTLILAEGKRLNELTVAEISACARIAIRSLALKYMVPAQGGLALRALFLQPEMEQRLMEAGTRPLEDHEIRRFREAVFNTVSGLSSDAPLPILVSQHVRAYVRELIFIEFPTISILGLYEVPPGTKAIEPVPMVETDMIKAATTMLRANESNFQALDQIVAGQ